MKNKYHNTSTLEDSTPIILFFKNVENIKICFSKEQIFVKEKWLKSLGNSVFGLFVVMTNFLNKIYYLFDMHVSNLEVAKVLTRVKEK